MVLFAKGPLGSSHLETGDRCSLSFQVFWTNPTSSVCRP